MLTHKRLLEVIEYNPETGMAFWKIRRGGIRIGARVGTIKLGSKRSKPYRYFRFSEMGANTVPFTHIVHFYMTGKWPSSEIDHKNGNTLDDRWSELRPSTRAQNEANRGARRNNKLGIKGVRRTSNGRYAAAIHRRGERRHIGVYETPQLAGAAYLAAAAAYDGEFLRAA